MQQTVNVVGLLVHQRGKKVKTFLKYWCWQHYWSSFMIQSLYDHFDTEDVSTGACRTYDVIIRGIKVLLNITFMRLHTCIPFSIIPCAILTSHCMLLYLLLSVSKCLYAIYTTLLQDVNLGHLPSACFCIYIYVLYASSFIFVFICNWLLDVLCHIPPTLLCQAKMTRMHQTRPVPRSDRRGKNPNFWTSEKSHGRHGYIH